MCFLMARTAGFPCEPAHTIGRGGQSFREPGRDGNRPTPSQSKFRPELRPARRAQACSVRTMRGEGAAFTPAGFSYGAVKHFTFAI
jgi:hypothetical protein